MASENEICSIKIWIMVQMSFLKCYTICTTYDSFVNLCKRFGVQRNHLCKRFGIEKNSILLEDFNLNISDDLQEMIVPPKMLQFSDVEHFPEILTSECWVIAYQSKQWKKCYNFLMLKISECHVWPKCFCNCGIKGRTSGTVTVNYESYKKKWVTFTQ